MISETNQAGVAGLTLLLSTIALLFPLEAGLPAADQASRLAFVFRDVGADAGIFPHLAGIRGHGAAWGEVDGDGWPDLFVPTFHNAGSRASLLPRNHKGSSTPTRSRTCAPRASAAAPCSSI